MKALPAALLLAALGATADEPPCAPAPRVEQQDEYHGQRVADPYRWLEALDSPQTAAWIEAQNACTRAYLDRLDARPYFARRLRELLAYERFGVPQHRNGRYAYLYNDGRADQDSLWVTRDLGQAGRRLVDPLDLRADGTVSITGFELSPDGLSLAYALSDGGSDWTTWQVLDIETGRAHGEVLRGTKFTGVAWRHDASGFYYSRYPARTGAPGYDDGRQVTIWHHVLGTSQAQDREVFAITDHPSRDPYPGVTDDGRYLVIRVADGYFANGIYYRDLEDSAGRVVRLMDRWDARYEFLGNEGSTFFFHTTHQAAGGRIVAVDLRRPGPEQWREVVAESDAAIQDAALVGGRLIVQYVANVRAQLRVFDLRGRVLGEVPLPGAGSVDGLQGRPGDRQAFFAYSDFTTPRGVYRYDVGARRAHAWRAPAPGIDPAAYATRQVRVRSRDGTEVPVYVVQRRDRDPASPQPAVLYGYGGFNVSLLPAYSAARAAWLEAGGLFALANLRGGGEFGERWHEAGTRLDKQNVFDDFIAAAEWLVGAGYTRREQLAIWGASNGGLLVGAVLNQRPELFAAAVPAVGVMDMLRYQLGSANARQWSSDYGLSEVPAEFTVLRAYSPYHNVRPGVCYPPTLVMADASDDRVLPWHSYKYAAALQAAQGCGRPVMVRIETRAGHGAGASISKRIEEYADQWAFVAAATGLVRPDAAR